MDVDLENRSGCTLNFPGYHSFTRHAFSVLLQTTCQSAGAGFNL